MESLDASLTVFFQWLLRATLQGSLLVCVILLIKMALRERLPARWHYCLWLVLLVRLCLPWAPQSRLSIYGLIPRTLPTHRASALPAGDARPGAAGGMTRVGREERAEPASASAQAQGSQRGQGEAPVASAVRGQRPSDDRSDASLRPLIESVAGVAPWLWLAGCLVLGGYVLVRAFGLWWMVRSERPVTDQRILDLLEDCKMQMRVRTLVGVVVTDKTRSPALFGFVRPRILLPQGLMETLGLDELHYVFLHELAHLRRRDIYLAWLVCLLQVLHWFNPLMWLAFRRMRADQEVAADALVLSTSGSGESPKYGQTIVSLLERFSRPQYLPSLAGILENPSHVERRIQMIARFKNNSYRWSPLAAVLIVAVACLSLPDARSGKAAESSAAKPTGALGAGEQRTTPLAGETNVLVDPKTGITFRKVGAFVGANAVGDYWRLHISPNGKFLLEEAGLSISPLDGGKPFKLVDLPWPTEGCWSPDGRKIAFRSGNPDSLAIWVVRVDPDAAKPTGPPKRLVEGAGGIPRWLPDSERVLFSRFDGQTPSLWSVSISDGALTQITDFSSVGIPSPDGENIVYSEDPIGLNKPIWVKSTTGGPSRRLDDGGYPDSWSADGKWVHRWGWARFLRIADGRQVDIEVPTEVGSPVVPPALAGRKMYFFRSAYDFRRLFKVVSALGGPSSEPGMGMAIHNWEGFPTWWPDSQAIIVHGTKGNDGNLWALPLTAGQPIPFKADAFAMGSESRFSPDLQNLLGVIRTSYDPNSELDVFDVCVLPVSWREMCAAGPAVPIFKALKSGTVGLPAVWSPDGKKIAVADIGSIHVVPATGGEPVQLAKDSKVIDWLDWSPDGKTIAFHQVDTEGIQVVSSSGGEVKTVCSIGSSRHIRQRSLCWSPDSQAFVMAIRNHAIVSVSIADGSTRPLVTLSDLGKNDAQRLCFSPDGKCLAFVAEKPPHDGPLFVLHVESGKVDQLTGEESPSGLRWSPDGKWISYYTPQKPFKTRAESVLWEMDVEEALAKLAK